MKRASNTAHWLTGILTILFILGSPRTTVANEKRPHRGVRHGVLIGVNISTNSDLMPTHPTISYSMRLEMRHTLLAVNAGIGLQGSYDEAGSRKRLPFHALTELVLAGYPSRKATSPYIGAGTGMFIGDRFIPDCSEVVVDEEEDETYSYYEPDCSYGSFGLELFPVFGVAFRGSRKIVIYIESRYLFSIAVTNKMWGHGPSILAGLGF